MSVNFEYDDMSLELLRCQLPHLIVFCFVLLGQSWKISVGYGILGVISFFSLRNSYTKCFKMYMKKLKLKEQNILHTKDDMHMISFTILFFFLLKQDVIVAFLRCKEF